MEPITTAAELSRATRAKWAVIFLWVEWSVQARQAERLLREAVERLPAEAQANVFKVDVSDETRPLWTGMQEYLDSAGQDAGQLMILGAGSLLLCREGRVESTIICPPNQITRSELIKALIALRDSAE